MIELFTYLKAVVYEEGGRGERQPWLPGCKAVSERMSNMFKFLYPEENVFPYFSIVY